MSLSLATDQAGGAAERNGSRRVARLNPQCVVCGPENRHGLHLAFTAEAQAMRAEWLPGNGWESFQGVVHGGIVTAVLDEAMSKAIIAAGLEAFTVDLHLRFRRKLCTGESALVQGWIVQKEKRRIRAEASLRAASGEEYAHAWGVFLIPPHLPRSSGGGCGGQK